MISRQSITRVLLFLFTALLYPVLAAMIFCIRLFRKNNDPRIVIMHFAGIGDTLLMTPALQMLREKYPGSTIDLALTHPRVKTAFSPHPALDHIMTLPQRSKGYLSFDRINKRFSGLIRVLYYFPDTCLQILFGCYDIAIVYALSGASLNLSGSLSWLAMIPCRAGLKNLYLNRQYDMDYKTIHRMHVYIKILSLLNIEKKGLKGQDYYFPLCMKDMKRAQQTVENYADLPKPWLVMHPGGVDLQVPRRWPESSFRTVAEWFEANTGGSVFVIGSEDEMSLCRYVADTGRGRIISVAGDMPVRETAGFLKHADLFLSNDTGTMHMAGAVHVPGIFAVFGPTDPSLLIPKDVPVHAFQATLPCVPCAGSVIDGKTRSCIRDVEGECLKKISPEMVINEMARYVKTHY